MTSDRLAAVLPANQKPGLKIFRYLHVCNMDFNMDISQ